MLRSSELISLLSSWRSMGKIQEILSCTGPMVISSGSIGILRVRGGAKSSFAKQCPCSTFGA